MQKHELQFYSQKKHYRPIGGILAEKSDRSEKSRLTIYDAWETWRKSGPEKALDFIFDKSANRDTDYRLNILTAILAVQCDQYKIAEQALSTIDVVNTLEEENGKLLMDRMLIRSARLRLTVDLKKEIELFRLREENKSSYVYLEKFSEILRPMDLVIPGLFNKDFLREPLESLRVDNSIQFPYQQDQLQAFIEELNNIGRRRFYRIPNRGPIAFKNVLNYPDESISADELGSFAEKDPAITSKVLELARMGRNKWILASMDLYIFSALDYYISKTEADSHAYASIFYTLAIFNGQPLRFRERSKSSETLQEYLNSMKFPVFTREFEKLTKGNREIIDFFFKLDQNSQDSFFTRTYYEAFQSNRKMIAELLEMRSETLRTLIVYVFSPDPLEILLNRATGLPLPNTI